VKNMHFIEMQGNQPVSQGVLGRQIGNEHFVARFFSPRKFTRVVSLKMLESYALFESPEEAAAFLAPSPVAPASDVPAGTQDQKELDSKESKQAE